MKSLLLALCAFTLCAAAWLAVMETVLRHPGFPGRIGVASLLLVQSAATVAVLQRGGPRVLRMAVLCGAFGIAALGVTAIGRVLAGAHFEGFVLVIATALILQALTTLVLLLPGPTAHPKLA